MSPVTPPEPVAWDSRPAAPNFTTFEALQHLWLRLLFKALFWFFAPYITTVLGWPLNYQAAFFPFCKNKKICSVSPKIWLANCRIGYSYSYRLSQISLLFLLNLLFIPITPQIPSVTADATSTIPTRLIIPGINLDSAVVPVGWKKVVVNGQIYGQWEVDNNLVGWHNLSAPLGQTGNSVFNGHSNLYAQVFDDLGKVAMDDRIFAFAGDQVYSYVVAEKFLVQEKGVSIEKRLENAKLILPTLDERLTLITCAQPDATHRLIVIAYRDYSYSK